MLARPTGYYWIRELGSLQWEPAEYLSNGWWVMLGDDADSDLDNSSEYEIGAPLVLPT